MSNTPFSNMDASSLRSYSEFVRNLPVAVYRTTLEGRIAFCNEPFARIFGFDSVNDAIGFPEIKLYRNKEDRGTLVQSILQRGIINEMPVPFSKRDQTPIWCSVTTKATFDDDGEVVFLDGLVRDITGEIEETVHHNDAVGPLDNIDKPVLVLDAQGAVIKANEAVAKLIGCPLNQLSGRSFAEFLTNQDQQIFFLFLGDLIRIGREEIILKIPVESDRKKFLRLYAAVAKSDGGTRHINCVVSDVTERIKTIREKTNRDKFQGVLEMAGGVAHRFNQPLTIVNNLINEMFSELQKENKHYDTIAKILGQIQKLNDITRKVGNIKKYEAIDYVAGVKIVDIDKAS